MGLRLNTRRGRDAARADRTYRTAHQIGSDHIKCGRNQSGEAVAAF